MVYGCERLVLLRISFGVTKPRCQFGGMKQNDTNDSALQGRQHARLEQEKPRTRRCSRPVHFDL